MVNYWDTLITVLLLSIILYIYYISKCASNVQQSVTTDSDFKHMPEREAFHTISKPIKNRSKSIKNLSKPTGFIRRLSEPDHDYVIGNYEDEEQIRDDDTERLM